MSILIGSWNLLYRIIYMGPEQVILFGYVYSWTSDTFWLCLLLNKWYFLVMFTPEQVIHFGYVYSWTKVAGGDDTSVMQPAWSCDNELLYISDHTDWWNLYYVTSAGKHVNLLPRDVECGGPQWVFGLNPFSVDPKGTGDIVTVYGQVGHSVFGHTSR